MKRLPRPAEIPKTLLEKLETIPMERRAGCWDGKKGKTIEDFKEDVKKFKDLLLNDMKVVQKNRCAWCYLLFTRRSPERDHVAPKSIHPQFTFEVYNLVIACGDCNTRVKRTYDPIKTKDEKYPKCEFAIVHPFFDNPEEHLSFAPSEDGDSFLIAVVNGSPKGLQTIKVLWLDEPELAKERAKDAWWASRGEKLEPAERKVLEDSLQFRRPGAGPW